MLLAVLGGMLNVIVAVLINPATMLLAVLLAML